MTRRGTHYAEAFARLPRPITLRRGPARGSLRARGALLLGVVLLGGAAACDSGTPASRPSSASPGPPASSPSAATLHIVPARQAAVVVHSGVARVTFSFAGQPPPSWSWRVVDRDRAVIDKGVTLTAGSPPAVVWDGRASSGGQADPGLYRLQIGPVGATPRWINVGVVRYEPATKATVFRRLPAAGNLVALTFDGGSGHAWRKIMLDLVALHAKGTFFSVGACVKLYPRQARQAVNWGMTIGSHSFSHPLFTSISNARMAGELTKAESYWWSAAATIPEPYFRPPYGGVNDRVLKVAGSLGYSRIILWDVDTSDWTGIPAAKVAANAVSGARPGSIILMHTDWNAEKALTAMVRGLREKGLEPVSLDELFRAAGYR
jgi:peptidoglycan/xylan/chitin deacetylase (PgdA/CDA1 family)